MEITKVNLRLVENMNKVRAIASVTFDDEFVVNDIRLVEGDKGFFVAMPSRKLPDGNYKDVAHPIKTEMREKIQQAVMAEYENKKSS